MLRITSPSSSNLAILSSFFNVEASKAAHNQSCYNRRSPCIAVTNENIQSTPSLVLPSTLTVYDSKELSSSTVISSTLTLDSSESMEDLTTRAPLAKASLRPISRSMSDLHNAKATKNKTPSNLYNAKATKNKTPSNLYNAKATRFYCRDISAPEQGKPLSGSHDVLIMRQTSAPPALSKGTFGDPRSERKKPNLTLDIHAATALLQNSEAVVVPKSCTKETSTSHLNTVHSSQDCGDHAPRTRLRPVPPVRFASLSGPTSPSQTGPNSGTEVLTRNLNLVHPSGPKRRAPPPPGQASNLETIVEGTTQVRHARRAPAPPGLGTPTRVVSPAQSETDKFPSATGPHWADQYRPDSMCLKSLVPALVQYASRSTDVLQKVKDNVDVDQQRGNGRTYLEDLRANITTVQLKKSKSAKPKSKSLWSKMTSWHS